jgi:predicted RNA-binding Zn-ribbon protein involved in translation (DUF1610 family)
MSSTKDTQERFATCPKCGYRLPFSLEMTACPRCKHVFMRCKRCGKPRSLLLLDKRLKLRRLYS